ncbi:MAG: OmpH family outer membrane protein [candidate division WOR-3 bacterium]|nr:OmpH family outer membrane protein [candidate division WOR-3 bacterium]
MKRYWTLVFILLTLPALAEQKIGYIDSQRVLSEYKGAAEIKSRYEQKISEWRNKAENLKNEIQKLQKSFQTQSLMLSEEAKLRKAQEIEKKQQEYQQFIQSVWGQGGEAERLNQELMQPLLREIDTLLTKIGKEEEYSVILDASSGAVVYADDLLDITDRVIESLNRKYLPVETTGKIKYYVFKFKEEDSESKSSNLGGRIKNLITTSIEGIGGYEQIEPVPLKNAKNSLGILREEEITETEVSQILNMTDGDFIVMGRVWMETGNIFFEFKAVDKKKGQAVITKTVDVGVEENLTKRIPEQVVPEIGSYYK